MIHSIISVLKKCWINPIWNICCAIRNKGGIVACWNLVFRRYREGLSIKTILRESWKSRIGTGYFEWQERFEKLTPQDMSAIRKQIQGLQSPPLISILMPVYNPDPHLLRQALDSVQNQIYPYWELCIADDASPNAQIQTILEDYCRADSRIHVIFRKENGHIISIPSMV